MQEYFGGSLMAKTKISVSVIILFLLCSALSCCTLPAGTLTGDNSGKAVPVFMDDPDKPVALKWYMTGDSQEPDMPMVLGEANKMLKEKINATVDLVVYSAEDEYDLRINAALAAGEAIDIVLTSDRIANYYQNASSGYFAELDAYLDRYPAIREILGEAFLDASRVNGKYYAVPANRKKVHNWGYILRKDLVGKYNMDISQVKSIEDIEPFLEIIWENEPRVTPFAIAGMDAPFQLLDWDAVSGGDIPGALYPDNRDTKIVNQFLAPESIDNYKLMKKWYDRGYIHPDAASMRNLPELLKTGRFFAAVQELEPGKDAAISASTGFPWVQVEITRPVMSNSETREAMLAIPAGSQNTERAFRFIELLYTDSELINLLRFGIENVHYRKISENVIRLEDPENSRYNPGDTWRFGDYFKNYLTEKEDPEKWDKLLDFNNRGFVLDSLGFVFNNSATETQAAACKNIVQAYCGLLFTGSDEIEPTAEQFRRELKAAGVEDLIAEMQNQYDAWLAAKDK